jgi:hypothetical protein
MTVDELTDGMGGSVDAAGAGRKGIVSPRHTSKHRVRNRAGPAQVSLCSSMPIGSLQA